MPEEKLILVAATTGYQTRSFAEAARRLGIQVVLATDRCHVLENPWADNAIPVQFDQPEISAATIADAMPNASGIVAVADRPTLVAALAAELLHLPFHPPAAVRICRNKHLSRQAFEFAGLPVPNHFAVVINSDENEAAARAPYPCVLKPLGLSASRGVIRADSPAEAVTAFRRIRRLLLQPEIVHAGESLDRSIQFEDFIPGREFALEGLLTHGTLRTLAIFDKPDPLDGPFFEETIYVTPSRASEVTQQNIISTAERAASALGLSNGPIHAEMRVNPQGIWMLEAAARPIGGLCAKALRFAGDITLEELVILHALGRMPAQVTPASPASGVMMLPVPRAGILSEVRGLEEALATPGIVDVVITAKLGQRLIPLPEGASYPGFLFASADTPDAVEHSLRVAHNKLRFDMLAALDVLTDSNGPVELT